VSNHAEVIAETLAGLGVNYVFGLPGGELSAFVDACRRNGLRFLLTGHETSAAMMAQVLGQITGIPGVCAATLGPGATNLVTGVANAFLDRAPLLALTAQIPQAQIQTMSHQRLDLHALFASITKRSATVGDGDTAELVRESFALAAAPLPGPVHLSLPSDVAVETFSPKKHTGKPDSPVRQESTPSSLKEIAASIAASTRPLVLVGLHTPPAAASDVRAFVNKLGAPFLVTPKAKGILSEGSPLFLGVASGMAIDGDILETIRMADVVVGIGFDPVECDKTWFSEIKIVSVCSAPMAEGDYRPIEAVGEISSLVNHLTSFIREPRPWPEDVLAERRKAITRPAGLSQDGVSPLALVEAFRAIFPRNGITTCDVGAHKMLSGQFWRTYEPGTFFMSNGLSAMGFGIPAAVAAQLAYPDRAVMTIVGDGGMLMMAHDLALIRELNLPIIIVCLADGSLSIIQVSQERRGFIPYGVNFQPPSFAAMAEAFGIRGQKATTLKDAKAAFERALEERRSMLLEVHVNRSEYYDLM